MSYKSYISAGIQKDRGAPDQLSGGFEVFLYNPTDIPCDSRMTIFFTDREPYAVEKTFHIPPRWSYLQHTGNLVPEVLKDCGFWGAEYESNIPMIPILIFGTGGFGEDGLDASLTGGVTHFLGTDLGKVWYFPNGIRRNHSADLPENPFCPPVFSEFEIYYFLNPSERDSQAEMKLHYADGHSQKFRLPLPAKRLNTWNNFDQVIENVLYGVTITSDIPISVSAVRYLYDPAGMAKKGIFVRAGMPAIPGTAIS